LVLAAWDKLVKGDEVDADGEEQVLSPIYSEYGVIKTAEESAFAGLVLALIKAGAKGMSVDQLQDTVVHIALAERYLNADEMSRLQALQSTVSLLSQTTTLALIQPFVQRLESAGLLLRNRSGSSVVYVAKEGVIPSDVAVRAENDELATLMLKLEAKRSETTGQRDEGNNDGVQVNAGR
jgi:hypothetical protein